MVGWRVTITCAGEFLKSGRGELDIVRSIDPSRCLLFVLGVSRYFSGFFAEHPLLQKYDFYWRVEPDSECSPSNPYLSTCSDPRL